MDPLFGSGRVARVTILPDFGGSGQHFGFFYFLLIISQYLNRYVFMGEGSGRGSSRVGSDFLSAIAGRVGSKKSDPWTTLIMAERPTQKNSKT